MEHKWFLLWHHHGGGGRGGGADPAEAQINQKEGRFSLFLVCAYVCVVTCVSPMACVCVLYVLCVVYRPRSHSESTTQPPHADTHHQHQYHSSQRGAYN